VAVPLDVWLWKFFRLWDFSRALPDGLTGEANTYTNDTQAISTGNGRDSRLKPRTLKGQEKLEELENWDSTALATLIAVAESCSNTEITLDQEVSCTTVAGLLRLVPLDGQHTSSFASPREPSSSGLRSPQWRLVDGAFPVR